MTIKNKEQMVEKDKKLKLFKIALIAGSLSLSPIEYYAEDEEDCKALFLVRNQDLDETDFWVKEVKSKWAKNKYVNVGIRKATIIMGDVGVGMMKIDVNVRNLN